MRSRSLLMLLLVAAVAAGCTVGAASTADSGLLARLEIEGPPSIEWTRTIDGVTVEGSTARPAAAELDLLEQALREIPQELRDLGEPGHIYRIAGDTEEAESGTLAFSRGTDVYLIDRTFEGHPTALDMAVVLAHEMTHVAQFRALEDADVEAVVGTPNPDPIAGSAFVAAFAEVVGWRQSIGDTKLWSLPNPAGATVYGQTAPDEDMADAVALVALGRADEVNELRVRWVEDWLQATATGLAAGKPYVPAGGRRIESRQPIYDEAAVAARAPGGAEPTYYLLPTTAPAANLLVADIQSRLASRGLAGILERIDDPRVERYGGFFTRGDGVGFRVELWDFRRSTGFVTPPPGPVLSYVRFG